MKAKTQSIEEAVADRRSFLKLAGATAAATGAVVVTGGANAATDPQEKAQGLYRETEHIRRYYELAR